MSLKRFATPISIIEMRTENGQKCPYCRWRTQLFYRLDNWPDTHAGCASCVLKLLADDDEYLIHHTRGPMSILTNHDGHVPPRDSTRSRLTPPTEPQPALESLQTHRSADG